MLKTDKISHGYEETHTKYKKLQQAAALTAPHMSTQNETKLVHVRSHFHLATHFLKK